MSSARILFLSLLASVTLASCGGGNDDGGTTAGATTVPNTNANSVTMGVPAEVKRLEFPAIKGGTSEVVVHSTGGYGMTYAIEWDHNLQAQRWTCFQIHDGNDDKNWSRNSWSSTTWKGDPFQHDPLVPSTEQPRVTSEFSKSYYPGTTTRYDRGHICASEDRVYSKEANEQTFYMTNMMPQVNAFNAGIWVKMENKVRTLASTVDTLYVVKGGTIDSNILAYTNYEADGRTYKHIVPRYFFMACLGKNAEGYKAFGFWVEHLNQNHSNDKLGLYVVNISELERLTGLDFFCNLPDDIEKRVENLATENVKRAWGLVN